MSTGIKKKLEKNKKISEQTRKRSLGNINITIKDI